MTLGNYVTIGSICVGIVCGGRYMTWRLETTTGMWKEKEQAARAFANAVVKSGLRGWVESDIVGIRAIVDVEMGGTLRTYTVQAGLQRSV